MFDFCRVLGRKALFMVLFVSVLVVAVDAQDVKTVSLSKYISNCLYNFSRHIAWPAGKKTGSFVITIIASKEVYTELTKLTQNMKVGLQPIEIRYFNTVKEFNGSTHMLFIGDWQSYQLSTALQKVSGSGTLVVTETEGMIVKGSMINFVPVDGMMQFEINQGVIHKNSMVVSTKLESMAARVI